MWLDFILIKGMSKGKENSVKTLVSRGAGISFKSAEHSGNITWGSCDDDTMTFQILRHFILTFYISIFDTSDIEAFDTYGFTPLHRMASNNLRFESKPYIVSSKISFVPSNLYKILSNIFLSQPRSESFARVRSRPSKCWENWSKSFASGPQFKCQRCSKSSTG